MCYLRTASFPPSTPHSVTVRYSLFLISYSLFPIPHSPFPIALTSLYPTSTPPLPHTGAFETYELGLAIVRSSKLYANQRRSNRQLPGGSDSTTAACYMLGGTPDSTLSPLVARVSPCDPREERCKAVERVLKDKTRGAICSLNGDNPREARADNLAAVRICEVVADILVAYAAKRLLGNLQQLYKANAAKDAQIDQLRAQLEGAKRRRAESCWCGAQKDDNPLGPPSARVSPDGIFASAVPLLNGNGVSNAAVPGRHSAPAALASLARTAALPALPGPVPVQVPAGSSPLGVAAAAADGYAGALDAVTAAATQWPHNTHDRK